MVDIKLKLNWNKLYFVKLQLSKSYHLLFRCITIHFKHELHSGLWKILIFENFMQIFYSRIFWGGGARSQGIGEGLSPDFLRRQNCHESIMYTQTFAYQIFLLLPFFRIKSNFKSYCFSAFRPLQIQLVTALIIPFLHFKLQNFTRIWTSA